MASPRLGSPLNESSGVAVFISKVWQIVENPDYNSLVSWSQCGKNVIIHDYPKFARDILPHYFKHNNFNSFVRQLNLYGFRKVAKADQGALSKVQLNEPIEFWHPNFRKGHPELLYLVQRRPVNSRIGSEEKSPQLNKVFTDIHQMKGKQENISSMLDAMRQDNIHLKRELELLKEKHIRQQRVLNKIIQFLVHMVYKGRLPSSNRRRPSSGSKYLMLTDSEGMAPPPKRMKASLDTSPSNFAYSDVPSYDSVSIESVRSVDSNSSMPTPPPAFTVTSPPVSPAPQTQSMPSLDSTVPNNSVESTTTYMEPMFSGTSTFITPVAPPTFTTPSNMTELSTLPSTVMTSSTVPTSPPLPSPPTTSTSLDLLPVLPDPTTQMTSDLIGDFPLDPNHAAMPEWINLTGHIDTHQQEIDSLPNVLSNQLSVDPSIISQFVDLGSLPVPDYDAIDTARLLETLSGEDSEQGVLQERSPQTAIVPLSQAHFPLIPPPSSSSSSTPDLTPYKEEEEHSSSLRELLELKDVLSDSSST